MDIALLTFYGTILKLCAHILVKHLPFLPPHSNVVTPLIMLKMTYIFC